MSYSRNFTEEHITKVKLTFTIKEASGWGEVNDAPRYGVVVTLGTARQLLVEVSASEGFTSKRKAIAEAKRRMNNF